MTDQAKCRRCLEGFHASCSGGSCGCLRSRCVERRNELGNAPIPPPPRPDTGQPESFKQPAMKPAAAVRRGTYTPGVIDLIWESPTRPQRTGHAIAKRVADSGVLDQLSARPGEWARIITYDTATGAQNVAMSLTVRLPAFEFAACLDRKTSAVYARARAAS